MAKSKQDREWVQLKVGLFIVGGLALAMVAIFSLSSRSSFFRDQYRLYAYFDDISGLTVGSQVKIAGVNAGFVESITFEDRAVTLATGESSVSEDDAEALEEDESDDEGNVIDSGGNVVKDTGVKVRVNLKIDRKLQDRIREDSVASITTQGLLGDGIIFLSVGNPGKAALQDGDRVVKVRNPAGFSQLQRKGEGLIRTAGGLLENANDLVTHLNSIMREVKTGKGLVHTLVYDEDAGKLLKKAGTVADNINTVALNINTTAKHFASISGKIDAGKGTVGKFINDPGVYNDLSTLLGKANRNKLVRSVIRFTMATRDVDKAK